MSSSYSSKLRDARWQRKRLEIMERDKWTCRSCGASGEGVTLNVHHAYYESGKDPWEYPDNTLVTWCEKCHKTRHQYQNYILTELNRLPIGCARGVWTLAVNYESLLMAINDNSKSLPSDFTLSEVIKAVCYGYSEGMEDATFNRAEEGGDE